MIFLLGRRDSPTDGVEDYCNLLGQSFAVRGTDVRVVRVSWATEGRLRSLRRLRQALRGQAGQWVLAQYTALSWSRRGFPVFFLLVLWLLRSCRIPIAVVFHDSSTYRGRRPVDRLRGFCQRLVMRTAYHLAGKSILTAPLDAVSWIPRRRPKAVFIPVGSNIPAVVACRTVGSGHPPKTIAVFGVTGDGYIGTELTDIAFVVKAAAAQIPGIRLTMLGRGSKGAESTMREILEDPAVEFSALGVLPADEVSKVLSAADVSLFVRGSLSTQRGSAIASVACGTPLVAYSGPQLPVEFDQAGVVAVSPGDREAMARATISLLTDRQMWLELHRRSRQAYKAYFSWETVAARFLQVLANA